jgi:energy-coupling factor transport system permease protein
LIITIFWLNSWQEYLCFFVLIYVLARLSDIGFIYYLKGIKSLWFFFFLAAIFQIWGAYGHIIFKWGSITITRESLFATIAIILRFIYMLIVSTILTLTTSPVSIADAIESLTKKIKKFPSHEFGMILTISLRFIPIIFNEVDKISKAQKARGAKINSKNPKDKLYAMVSIIIPLLISSFRRADELAMAMDARCYSGSQGRTKYRTFHLRKTDLIFLFLIILVFIFFIIV